MNGEEMRAYEAEGQRQRAMEGAEEPHDTIMLFLLTERARGKVKDLYKEFGGDVPDQSIREAADYLTPASIYALTEILTENPNYWWTVPDMTDIELSPGKVLQVIVYEMLVDAMYQEIENLREEEEQEDEEEDNG